MKEIGGYMELDNYHLPMLHEDAIALNCGRNSLAYLIEARDIKKIKLPLFLCDCIRNLCEQKSVKVSYYHIDEKFYPKEVSLEEDEWLYVVNFYGQLTNTYIEELSNKYIHVIVDNAQAYFQMPVKGVNTLYTCRKFFGVSDGSFLYTDTYLDTQFEIDISFNRMGFVLGRFEKTASEFYAESAANNDFFDNEPVKYMSKLTKNLLHGIDYEYVKQKRIENFTYLHENLKELNKLNLQLVEGAFMYPFYHEKAIEIRKKLQQEKIYIPTLWPNVLEDCNKDDLEFLYAQNILPLPCDQRYGQRDMEQIIYYLMNFII